MHTHVYRLEYKVDVLHISVYYHHRLILNQKNTAFLREAFIIHVATLSVNLTLRVGGWV